jgi:siroheme synthase
MAGIPFEVVPGITSATAAPALVGIPVTHRGIASAFLVVSGHAMDTFDAAVQAVQPNGVSLVVLMGLAERGAIAGRLIGQGWKPDTPAAIACAVSTPEEWTWTGALAQLGAAQPPAGLAGVLVVGEVVRVREVLATTSQPADAGDEVSYGRNR